MCTDGGCACEPSAHSSASCWPTIESRGSSRVPRHHLRRPSTNMESRNVFLKPFKKLKHRLTRGSRKRDGGSGSGNNQEGGETDVEGSEASRRNSNLHPEVGDAIERGPSRGDNDGDGRKVEQADPPAITPSISCDKGPDGT